MESDVQKIPETNKEMEMNEASSSDQQFSKNPILPKSPGSPKKKLLKSLERPSSAKSFVVLENKYKASVQKFQKEFKEMQMQNDKVRTTRETMMKLRDEMQEKGQTDLPALPDVSSAINISGLGLHRSPSKGKKQDDCNIFDDEIKGGRYHLDEETLELIKAEVPSLERTLTSLEMALNTAHEKQNNLETNLDNYKEAIAALYNEIGNVSAVKKNSELLIQELEYIKREMQNERSMSLKEIESKDEEIKRLRGQFESEFSKRKFLEEAHAVVLTERDRLKEDCEDYESQIEKIKKNQIPTGSDLADLNGQLQIEVDDLKTKLSMAQRKLATVTDENNKNKQEVRKLIVEREEIKNEFISHCQQILFEKEGQIYSIKSKMDSIVNLKNTIGNFEDRGEPFFNIDLVMNINDANSLKKEVVCLHKKLISIEGSRSDLERQISTKDIKISGLEEELVDKTQKLIRMEHFIEMMKMKELENVQLLASIDLPSELFSNYQPLEDYAKEEKLKELVVWYEKQKETVAELENELRNSEERYFLSEERRVRNEERIANLQLKLAKYQYLR